MNGITIYKITNNFSIFMEFKLLQSNDNLYIENKNSVIQNVMLYLYL